MRQVIIENPVLNSPYKKPERLQLIGETPARAARDS